MKGETSRSEGTCTEESQSGKEAPTAMQWEGDDEGKAQERRQNKGKGKGKLFSMQVMKKKQGVTAVPQCMSDGC